jgi:citrate synthase
MLIHDKIDVQLPEWRERVRSLTKEHGSYKVADVTVEQIYGGVRGVIIQVSDISYLDPYEGIRLRGYSIPEVLKLLPKPKGAEMPYVGGLYYLLLVGEIPTEAQAQAVEAEWIRRSDIPQNVLGFLVSNAAMFHPMTLLSQAVLGLQPGSQFTRRYHEGMKKDEQWLPMLEDSLDLTAKLPVLAAYIYNLKYRKTEIPKIDPKLDMGANFARMIGVDGQEYEDVSRLYFILHSDHELGNVSAHVTHLVASSLSDIYFAFSAGLNGLAGPLHGLANQECLGWLLDVHRKFGAVPSKDQLRQFAWDWLNSGRVIPGYGHAVLRVPDPRFTAQFEFAQKHFPEDEILRLAAMVYEIVPQVLKEQGKAKNPAPNVDAISGTLQYHYGVREFDFYTVLFGVGRALGVTANAVWARALGQPIERPKSLTTAMLEDAAKGK